MGRRQPRRPVFRRHARFLERPLRYLPGRQLHALYAQASAGYVLRQGEAVYARVRVPDPYERRAVVRDAYVRVVVARLVHVGVDARTLPFLEEDAAPVVFPPFGDAVPVPFSRK